jgi:hypothetical protein
LILQRKKTQSTTTNGRDFLEKGISKTYPTTLLFGTGIYLEDLSFVLDNDIRT